jgi:hypothetical protein
VLNRAALPMERRAAAIGQAPRRQLRARGSTRIPFESTMVRSGVIEQGYLAVRPPTTATAGSMQDGIGANCRASRPFQALIRISSRNGGDMWGWFQLILDSPARANPPTCRAFAKKRLMGFEPTTFCMARDFSPTTAVDKSRRKWLYSGICGASERDQSLRPSTAFTFRGCA